MLQHDNPDLKVIIQQIRHFSVARTHVFCKIIFKLKVMIR